MSAAAPTAICVGLVQINNSFSGQNYLPYAVAMLEAYVLQHARNKERYRFLPPLYKRMPVREAVRRLDGARIVGFSTYIWNVRISLEIARRIKAQAPDTVIIFGGPQVPDHPEEFLRENPFIDVVVHNEGERTFLDLLESWPDDGWRDVPGISFLDGDGRPVRTAPRERIRDLEEIPSPFLSGVLDRLVAENPDEKWIGLWETNRGCPFQCTYCDWGSATASKLNQFALPRLQREIEWFARHRVEYIFCCDANFGALKRDIDIARFVADIKARTGHPKALSVQSTKNATERAYITQKILSDAGLNKGVALSMQSMNAMALANIKRDNISLETYLELQRRFRDSGVETYSDLILGLPGETYDSFVEGIDTLIDCGQHNRIQFNNLSILPNAEMGDPAYQEKFGLRTIPSRIINIHGSRDEMEDDVPEEQMLVIATASLPLEDWRQVRAFSWMTALLYFDKLLQIPIITARTVTGLRYRALIEPFMTVDAGRYPFLASLRDFFLEEAGRIQAGGAEYVYSPEWLGIHWPADEYQFIRMTADGTLGRFYEESVALLSGLAAACGAPTAAIRDAGRLNRALLKQPFTREDVDVELEFDIPSLYHSVLRNRTVPLERRRTVVRVDRSSKVYGDFAEWCREVVWYGNKKGAYLYGTKGPGPELAGHY